MRVFVYVTRVAVAPVRAGIYARISSDREGDGLGVARQLDDCERLAERKGWRVVDRYVDDDVSAYSGRRRRHYARMLDDLRAGVIDGVVVCHLDRFAPAAERVGGVLRCLQGGAGRSAGVGHRPR